MLPLNRSKADCNLCLLRSSSNNVSDSFSRPGHKVHFILAGCFLKEGLGFSPCEGRKLLGTFFGVWSRILLVLSFGTFFENF